jgi:hypothetical protein
MEKRNYSLDVVAHFDKLGYLRCVSCHEARGIISAVKVYADNGAIHNETCDSCNRRFAARDSKYYYPQ